MVHAISLVFGMGLANGMGAIVAWAADGQLVLTVVDAETKRPIACRMHLTRENGRLRRPRKVPFWHDHFVFPGKIALRLPVGNYRFELHRGPEYLVRTGHFRIEPFADDTKVAEMKRFVNMSEHGWWSGDLDIRRPLCDVELLMEAEDLHIGQVVTWHNGKNQWQGKPAPEESVVRFDGDRYFSVIAGGHDRAGTTLLYFNLNKPLPWMGENDEYPASLHYTRRAHKRPGAWVDVSTPFSWDLPLLVAHGEVDSIALANRQMGRETTLDSETPLGAKSGGKPRDRLRYPAPWDNGRWSHDIYFKLLDCGLRIPPSASSASGVAPNPVGYNRLYVHVDGTFNEATWWENFKAGRVVVTNGPLISAKANGQWPGHVFRVAEGATLDVTIGLTLWVRGHDPISYLELIQNGVVVRTVRLEDYATTGRLPKLHCDRSGWFLVRAVTDHAETYRFAMTAPFYVEVGDEPRISKRAAEFFLDWVYERARQIGPKLADKAHRDEVLGLHRQARDYWKSMVARANAE